MNVRSHVAALVAVLLLSLTVFTGPAYSVNNVVFVVDGSGSMNDPFEKRPKLEIAKEALSSLVRGLPEKAINAGLVVYSGGCESSSATVPLARVNKQSLLRGIGAIAAKGKTPIASSLQLAEAELRDLPGEKAVILLTDGEETCNGDPQRAARELSQKGITVYVIGFDIPDVGAARDLQTLAKLGGGSYFTAATADGLRDALNRAAQAAEKGVTETFPHVQENIQIIVDSSGDMAGPYQGRTRLALAQAALRTVLKLQHPDRDNIALRVIRGRCGLSFPLPDVPFRLNNAPSIMERVDDLNPSGKRTLVDAVLAAIDDFNKPQFKDVNRRVLLLVGGSDSCRRPQAPQLIRERFEDASIKAKFKFIGIGLDERAMLELRQLAQAVGDQQPDNYLNEAQLSAAIRYYLEYQPAIDNVNAIADVLNGSLGLLREASKLIRQRNYEGAEEKIKAAEHQRKSTLKPYEDLARRRIDENFARVFEFAQRLREQQGRLVDVELKSINTAKKFDDDKIAYDSKFAIFKQQEARFKQAQNIYNQSVAVLNEAKKDYNQAVAVVNEGGKAANKAINEYNRLVGEATGVIKRLRP